MGIVKSIDYTKKDYESFRNSMVDQIPVNTPEWTDLSESDTGMTLLELLADGLDVLSYYQDRMANEAYLPTAKRRSSVINLCALIGYSLKNATPAKVTVKFTFAAPTVGVLVPRGFQVGTRRTPTEQSIVFEVANTVVVPDGSTTVDVDCIQGVSVSDEVLGSSTGAPDQSFTISQDSVIIDNSLEVWVRESATWYKWSKVDDFIDSTSTDRHYVVSVDDKDITTISFGDGTNGKIPPAGSNNIQSNYRVGGGIVGNVGSSTITRVISGGVTGITSVTNESSPYQLGTDKESIKSARVNAPRAYRMSNRLVIAQDIEDFSALYPGIRELDGSAGKTQAVVQANSNYNVYIKPTGGGAPSSSLKTTLQADIDQRRILGMGVTVCDPTYVSIDLVTDLFIKDNFKQVTVESAVQVAVTDYFNSLGFKQNVTAGDIYSAIMSVNGVLKVLIKNPDGTFFTEGTVNDGQIAVKGIITYTKTGGVV